MYSLQNFIFLQMTCHMVKHTQTFYIPSVPTHPPHNLALTTKSVLLEDIAVWIMRLYMGDSPYYLCFKIVNM